MSDVMRQEYRQLNHIEQGVLTELKQQAAVLYALIDGCGHDRELSLAKTRLEECVMWAVKSITR